MLNQRVGLAAIRGRRRVLPAMAALALVLAACGDDDEDADSASATSAEASDTATEVASTEAPTAEESTAAAPTTAATSDDEAASTTAPPATEPTFTGEVTLMVIAPETDPNTGGIGAYPQISAGARAAAAELNKAGGINGLEVKIELCDTKQDVNESFNCAQKAVDEGVLAAVATQDSRGTSYEQLASGGIPNVIAYAAGGNVADPNTYPGFAGSVGYTIGGLTALASQPGVASIAVAFLDDGKLIAQLEPLAGVLAIAYPDVKVNFVGIPPTAVDYAASVTTAGESDAIFLAMPADAIVQFRKTADQLGLDKPTGAPASTLTGGLEQLGDLGEGMFAVSGYMSATTASSPEIDAFKAAMAEHEPDAQIDDLTVNGYLGVMVVAKALEGAATVDSATLKAALDATAGIETGLAPPLQFSTPHPVLGAQMPRVFNGLVVQVQVVDGQLEPVSDYVDMVTGQ